MHGRVVPAQRRADLPSERLGDATVVAGNREDLAILGDLVVAELRVLAANANVARMKEAVLNDVDLHTQTARLVFGEGFTPRQRGVAKAVNFGYVFGGGAGVIARTAGISVSEARAAVLAGSA